MKNKCVKVKLCLSFLEMILLLLELDASLMILFLFQEHYGIYFANKEPEEYSRGAYEGEWNMDFFQIRNAKQIRRSITLGIIYSKHSRTRNFLCCYRMMRAQS